MSSCTKLRMLFCIKILFGLFGTIVANATIFDKMSSEERRRFFGTTDDAIPEFKLVTFDLPSRMKRSMKSQFTIHLNFKKPLETTLVLVLDNYLISRSTPIWAATSDQSAFNSVKYHPDPTVLERIGNFSFYHDIHNGSALTYFHGRRHLTGILCEHYAIKALSTLYTDGIVYPLVGRAVKGDSADSQEERRKTQESAMIQPIHVVFKIPEGAQGNFYRRAHPKGPIAFDPAVDGPATWPTPPKVFYPKILVTMDYGSIMYYNRDDFVVDLITFWNGVDMLYRQLDDPAVRLNIAGFIIPTDGTATPYMAPNTSNIDYVDSDYVLNYMGLHFYAENQRFPFDSYNILMAMTRKVLKVYDLEEEKFIPIEGRAIPSGACSKSVWFYDNDNTIGSVGIARFGGFDNGIFGTAHELAHILGVDHDGEGTSKLCDEQSGNVMVRGQYWAKFLGWSNCSKEAFKTFFADYSLSSCLQTSPPNQLDGALQHEIGSWLSINGTCQNLSKKYQWACELPNEPDICSHFGCMSNGICTPTSYSPYFGSSCGKGKHCFYGRCTPLS